MEIFNLNFSYILHTYHERILPPFLPARTVGSQKRKWVWFVGGNSPVLGGGCVPWAGCLGSMATITQDLLGFIFLVVLGMI